MGLDAGMQQPTACRKYEGDRVRRVAPKLIAKYGESHMPSARERGSPAQGLRIGQSRGSEKNAEVERREAYWSAAARDCGKERGKNHSHERDKGRRMCAPGIPQGSMEESTERTRWIPCARAVRSARAAIAPTQHHVHVAF
jgi:hypothetical protein